MGAKISIDSATMMNKGLEVIEAHLLFGLPAEQIEVVVHPQSVIHSMVAYRDGSVLAQLGTPDMRVPIAHALGWPARIDGPAAQLDFAKSGAAHLRAARIPAVFLRYVSLGKLWPWEGLRRWCSMQRTRSRSRPSCLAGSVSSTSPASSRT